MLNMKAIACRTHSISVESDVFMRNDVFDRTFGNLEKLKEDFCRAEQIDLLSVV